MHADCTCMVLVFRSSRIRIVFVLYYYGIVGVFVLCSCFIRVAFVVCSLYSVCVRVALLKHLCPTRIAFVVCS